MMKTLRKDRVNVKKKKRNPGSKTEINNEGTKKKKTMLK